MKIRIPYSKSKLFAPIVLHKACGTLISKFCHLSLIDVIIQGGRIPGKPDFTRKLMSES